MPSLTIPPTLIAGMRLPSLLTLSGCLELGRDLIKTGSASLLIRLDSHTDSDLPCYFVQLANTVGEAG